MSSKNPNARKSVRLKDYDYSQNGLYFITICCYKGICYFEKSHPNSVGADPCVGPNENAYDNAHNDPCVGPNENANDNAHNDPCAGPNENANNNAHNDPCVGPNENANDNNHNDPCVGPNENANDHDQQNLTIQLNDAGKMIEKWYYKLPEKFPHVKCHEMVVMPNHFHCIIQIAGSVRADTRVGPDRASLPTIMQWFKTMSTNEYIRGVKLYNWKPFYKKIWQRNYYEHIIRDKQSYHNITNYIYNNPAKWKFDRFNINKLKR